MVASLGTRVSQSRVYALGNYASVGTRVSKARVYALAEPGTQARISQARVYALARGRTADPNVRVWSFTMDGHDYIVLRLGRQETLIYDTAAQQWYVWASGDGETWRAYDGFNWLGATMWSAAYGSNVIVGDDGNGALYFLDPLGDYDDDALVGNEIPRSFDRVAQGQIAVRGFNSIPCYGVRLLGSVGEAAEASLTDVTLYTSDNLGNTYDDHGTQSVANGDYRARLEWLSLGSFAGPGRLFKVVDIGAVKRIDSLEMIDG